MAVDICQHRICFDVGASVVASPLPQTARSQRLVALL